MTCPRCGRPNPEEALQCAACGTALSRDNRTLTGFGSKTAGGAGSPGGAASRPPAGGRTVTGSGSRGTGTGGGGFFPGAALEPGTLLGPRYEILAVLGEGGMGTVYKARDLELGRFVALKVIRPEMASHPEILERFKREILLASQVTHKNVLRIHDLGEAGDIRFISMNFIEGTNLKGLLESEGPLPLDKGLPIARQIGEALQAAHDAGVVHRDLKPQNILLDHDGQAYIADFGISRSLAEGGTMTDTGTILGTVDYMSPEQARGETPDHRGDIYSFGLILYEMFTGSLPFRASNAISVMMKRLHEDAPSARQTRPEVPAWLAAIIARAMKRDPSDRYQSAGDLLRDLDRQRASRSLRRLTRPRVVLPAVAAILAVTLGVLLVRGAIPFPARTAATVTPRTSLVVLPFGNSTGDTRYDWVRTGLPSLIHSELIEAKALRLVGQDRTEDLLDTLKLREEADLRPETLRRIGSLLAAENVLSGRVIKVADRLRIEASLRTTLGADASGSSNPASGSIVVEGQGDQAIFGMVDDLARRVRDGLGVSRGFLEKSRSASDMTTRSVEALGLYSEGLALARAGQQLEAAKRLEGAIAKDPQFAVARAVLAETYDGLGYSDKAVAEANRAVAGIGPVSTFEATRIRAVQARLTNNTAEAIKDYRRLCEIAPSSAGPYFDLATVQEDSGDLEGARQSLRRVLTLDPKHPSAHYALGRVQYKLGQRAEALQEFNAALTIHVETGNDEGRATVLNGLGNAYRGMGKREEALQHYRESIEIRRRIGDRRGTASVLGNLAFLQGEIGKTDEAIASASEAIDISREIGDRNGQAFAYAELGDIYQDAGRPEDALKVYQDSLRLVRETDDQVNLARSLSNVGYINVVLGRYVEAYFFLKEALEKRRQIGDQEEIVRSLIDMGFLEQVQGRYEEALKYETEGLSLAKGGNNSGGTLVLLINLANIHEEQGEYGPAMSQLEEALKMAREMGDTRLIATCLIYEGSVRRHAGDLAGAETTLDEALKLAREIRNVPLTAEALTHRSGLHLARGQNDLALSLAREAVIKAKQSADRRLILLARLAQGDAARSLRDLEQVLGEAKAAGLAPLVASVHLSQARAHWSEKRVREAGAAATSAIEAATPLHLRDVLLQARHLAGQCLTSEAKGAQAAEQFSAALGPLDEIRQGLAGDLLTKFLARPEILSFEKDAGVSFQSAQRQGDSERLKAILHP